MEIIKCVEKSEIIKEYDILVFEIFEGGFYIKIRAALIDDTELYIREYSDVDERNYSYHWQDLNGRLLMRWDNAQGITDILKPIRITFITAMMSCQVITFPAKKY